MDQRNNEKPEEKDQVNKPTKTKRTHPPMEGLSLPLVQRGGKHIIKLKQENNDCFEIVIKKGNIILSLD